jgi:S-DNA-T family DNA segregation ATPase FtsK/SpoIIIE
MKAKLSDKNRTFSGKNKRRSVKDEEFAISEDFKKRLIGFLLFVIGILLFLSVLSYSKKDMVTLERFSFLDVFRKETYSSLYVINNWLGVAGAYISGIFVNNLFGYFSAVIALVIIILGYAIFRKKGLFRPLTFSFYALILMALIAGSVGVTRYVFDGDRISALYSGATGDFLALILYQTIGGLGASIFFIISLVVVTMLLIDGNIIKTFARFKLLLEKIIDSFRREKETLLEKKEDKLLRKTVQSQNNSADSIDPFAEAIRKEREKIQKLKQQKGINGDALIKDTGINRPKSDVHLLKGDENQIKEEDKGKRRKKEISLESLLVKGQKKENISEIDVNPDNSNELEGMLNKEEDDFIEEKLEGYKCPTLDLLDNPTREDSDVISDEELKNNGRLLQEKLLKFGIEIKDIVATPGPVVTLYELIPAPEVKLSKIESLQDDIALAMKARGIRMIIPIPGKGTVGVEIPNSKSQFVRIKSILSSQKFIDSTKRLTVAFGKMIDGEIYIDDLSKMPHALIAGATGSGKSVGINTIIASLLYKMHPSDLKFVMIDPKKIELSLYSKLRNHFIATSNDVNESIVTSPKNAVSVLKSVEMEMEQRYDKLANAGVRNIDAYNQKYSEGKLKNNEAIRHRKMPYIVVIIDELADLMITAKREIEEPIARIAQMARAVGIHLIVATQRPSVDVITGVIKANFPVRIAYQVASKIDSRTILDMGGADQLLRNGDMLYLSSSFPKPLRIQNAYISTEECEKLVDYISSQKGYFKPYLLPSIISKRAGMGGGSDEWDEVFPDAARLILKLQNCSTSTLQRRLKLGYARAARIVDQMELAGIVGPNQGAKGREILISEDELEDILIGL